MHESPAAAPRRVLLIAAVLSASACNQRRANAEAHSNVGFKSVESFLHPCANLASCEAACDGGSGPSCTFVGRIYEYADGVERDVPRALALYERACALGYLGGCYNVAVVLEKGQGVPRDAARAARLYRRVCAGGSPIACAAAARLGAAAPAADGGAR